MNYPADQLTHSLTSSAFTFQTAQWCQRSPFDPIGNASVYSLSPRTDSLTISARFCAIIRAETREIDTFLRSSFKHESLTLFATWCTLPPQMSFGAGRVSFFFLFFLNYEFPAALFSGQRTPFSAGSFAPRWTGFSIEMLEKKASRREVDVEASWNCDRVANQRTKQRACPVTSTSLPRPSLSLLLSLLLSLFLLLLQREIEDPQQRVSRIPHKLANLLLNRPRGVS